MLINLAAVALPPKVVVGVFLKGGWVGVVSTAKIYNPGSSSEPQWNRRGSGGMTRGCSKAERVK